MKKKKSQYREESNNIYHEVMLQTYMKQCKNMKGRGAILERITKKDIFVNVTFEQTAAGVRE